VPRNGSGGDIIATRSHKDIVHDMEAVLNHSMRIGSRVLLDWPTMLDLINELDHSLPQEYRDAQEILRDAEANALEMRRRVQTERENARAEANELLEDATQRARALASDHEIARLAEGRCNELMRHAEQYATQVRDEAEQYAAELRRATEEYSENSRRAADDYALRLLNHLKTVMTRAQASVEDGLQQMKR
jgi:regulator of protease activity HflC (stomatin/prohibitin superfamily)